MTDLTILIAVIALALWPIVFLISRILHERNKRAKPSGDTASAETEEVTEEMTTSALIMSILQQLGCQPEVNEENHISFKYQGDDFLVAAEDGLRLIIVWNPWWASISIDNQALPYLKEIINAVNMNSLVTTVYALDEDEKTFGIHSKCHMLFAPEEEEPEKSFTDLLDSFFTTHNTIKEKLVGTDAEAIVSNVTELLRNKELYRRMSETHNPYGDGHACERILSALTR